MIPDNNQFSSRFTYLGEHYNDGGDGGKLGPKIPFIKQEGYENGGDNDEDDYLDDKQYPEDINNNGAI